MDYLSLPTSDRSSKHREACEFIYKTTQFSGFSTRETRSLNSGAPYLPIFLSDRDSPADLQW